MRVASGAPGGVADLQAAYEQWHGAMGERDGSDSPWHLLVKKHLQPGRDVAGKDMLEIGCGRGGFTCWLAGLQQAPARIAACDFSETALAKAAAMAAVLGQRVIDLRWADLEK